MGKDQRLELFSDAFKSRDDGEHGVSHGHQRHDGKERDVGERRRTFLAFFLLVLLDDQLDKLPGSSPVMVHFIHTDRWGHNELNGYNRRSIHN